MSFSVRVVFGSGRLIFAALDVSTCRLNGPAVGLGGNELGIIAVELVKIVLIQEVDGVSPGIGGDGQGFGSAEQLYSLCAP